MIPLAGRSPRTILLLLATAAIGLTLAGWAIGEIMRLQPCPLCIFQRLLFLAIALLALIGALLPAATRVSSILLAVVAAGGVTTAAYQSWLQYLPQEGMECGFGEPTLIERIVDWFGALWPQMFLATGFCSSKDWILLGLSMANWSGLCFIGFLAAAAVMLRPRSD
ncbi:disulfide bond formation protein B [Accumulibacter sp.]|uniref:disulfide bond formation protein B n=1 Tax=Accumulibacter sp. TaxID=2053492 RepID=UPI0025F55F02|nr:disulfide bond formation protein B [Accumulibacter sp.]MCM8614143.1 disulfide bond formation protein B [Accumulibacter sp.]MCM8637910.1 disulfide bond formation protein B [Accumulibacter sp.]MCM8641379.1 disulfide bond formation protein B [Accumulibacter sp.]